MIDDPYLKRLAEIESGMNPWAQNKKSSAKGLFQFIDSTAQQYGLDPALFGTPEYTAAEIPAVTKFTEDNKNYLRQVLGREPTAGELYLAHQQGAGGASKLLLNPQSKAVDVVGADAVINNSGNPDITAQEFANQWVSKFNSAYDGAAEDAPLTPEEEAELAALEQESPLTPEEEAELAALEGGAQPAVKADTTLSQDVGDVIEGVKQGATMGFGDELQALIAAYSSAPFVEGLTVGDAYNQALTGLRGEYKTAQDRNKALTTLGELAGGLSTGLGTAGKAKGLTAYAAANPLKSAIGTGALSGGVYGFGGGEGGASQRLENAGYAGALGALGGAAGYGLTRAVSGGASAVANKLKKSHALEELAAKTGQPIEKIAKSATKIDLSPLVKGIRSPDTALAELGGEDVRRLARGAAQYPSGSKVISDFFEERIPASSDKIKTAFRNTISNKTDYYQAIDDIVKQGQGKVAPLYKEAYQANKSVASPLIDRILETPRGSAALADAVDQMRDQMALVATPDKELTAISKELANMGKMKPVSGGVASGLKLETLDKVKKGFDATYRKAKQAGDREEAARIANLRSEFVKELDRLDVSKKYAEARKGAGDYLTNEAAAEKGIDFFKTDKDLFIKEIAKMGDTEKASLKVGVAKAMRDAVDNLADNRDPYTKTFGSKATREKLKSILTPDEYKSLSKTMNDEHNLYKLRNFVLGNSATTGKAIDAAQFGNEAAELVTDVAQRGFTNVAMSKAVLAAKKIGDGLSDKSAENVAKMLFEQDPAKKLQILKRLRAEKGITKAETQSAAKTYFLLSDAIKNKKKALESGMLAGTAAGSSLNNPKDVMTVTVTPKDKAE